jgi:hypothetical protein
MARRYARTLSAVKTLQAAYRGLQARRRYAGMQRQQAALTLQAGWRGFCARRVYKTQQAAATLMQCAWRTQLSKRALRRFKTDAREAGAWPGRRPYPSRRAARPAPPTRRSAHPHLCLDLAWLDPEGRASTSSLAAPLLTSAPPPITPPPPRCRQAAGG